MRESPRFHCVAFSVTSRQCAGLLQAPHWQVAALSIDWDDIFALPKRRQSYPEGEFRRLAALNGWRLVNVAPGKPGERRLYFRRVFDPDRSPDN